MNAINEQFLMSIAIIFLGYLCKKREILKKEEGAVLNKIVLNITLPALTLKVFSSIQITPKLLLLALICFFCILVMYFVGKKAFFKESRADQGMLRICLLGFNIGLFAYPFVENIWGAQGMQYISIFDMGNAFMVFGLAYVVSLKHAPNNKTVDIKYIVKKLLNFLPLRIYILALCLNLFHIALPSILMKGVTVLSAANGPLVLLILGIYLEFSLEKSAVMKILKGVTIKYAVGFIAGIILFYILPFDKIFRGTVLLSFLLPTPMAMLAYGVENELNDRIGGGFINLTNIISFILMWIVFSFIH